MPKPAAKTARKRTGKQAKSRPLFPDGFSKDDARAYYQKVAGYLLPHLKDRPLSFKRYPGTVRDESFWEKDAPAFTPAWVKTYPVPRRSGESSIRYVVAKDLRSLLWIVEIGGVEIHPFLHKVPHLERPTHLVFDLDPGTGASLVDCCTVAGHLRAMLLDVELESFAKVSGSKGLQVYVPLNSPVTHDATEAFARAVAEDLARKHPEKVVAKMAKELRRGKVFVDWSQNADYKTTVAVYSLRAKRNSPFVSMPVTWDEVEDVCRRKTVRQLDFTPAAALDRLKRRGDLFAPLLRLKQELPKRFIDTYSRLSVVASRRTAAAAAGRQSSDEREPEVVVRGIKLPKPKSQSGRRLFVLPKGDLGNELWLESRGYFRRWILRPDKEGDRRLIAVPAGEFRAHPAYYRGEVQPEYRKSVTIADIGSYERLDGSFETERVVLFFNGHILDGKWLMEKSSPDPEHRSWVLQPVR